MGEGDQGNRQDLATMDGRIGEKYRKLLVATQPEEDPDVHVLKDKLGEAKKLFAHVKDEMVNEASLDAKLLRQLSAAGMRKAEKLHTNMVTFEPMDFAERMASFISTDVEAGAQNANISSKDWELFGRNVQSLFKRSPAFHFMFGSFTRSPPERKVRVKRKVEKVTNEDKKMAPQKMKELGKNDQEVTTEEVERVLEVLRRVYKKNGREPVGYFNFVVNPNSFSQTIQNTFHVSFLIKDGFARLYLNEENLPVIEPQAAQKASEHVENEAKTKLKALIISMNLQQWEDIVRLLKITQAAIPPLSK